MRTQAQPKGGPPIYQGWRGEAHSPTNPLAEPTHSIYRHHPVLGPVPEAQLNDLLKERMRMSRTGEEVSLLRLRVERANGRSRVE